MYLKHIQLSAGATEGLKQHIKRSYAKRKKNGCLTHQNESHALKNESHGLRYRLAKRRLNRERKAPFNRREESSFPNAKTYPNFVLVNPVWMVHFAACLRQFQREIGGEYLAQALSENESPFVKNESPFVKNESPFMKSESPFLNPKHLVQGVPSADFLIIDNQTGRSFPMASNQQPAFCESDFETCPDEPS